MNGVRSYETDYNRYGLAVKAQANAGYKPSTDFAGSSKFPLLKAWMGAEAIYEENPKDVAAIFRLTTLKAGLENDMKRSYPNDYALAINSLNRISTDAEKVIAYISAKDEN